MADNSEQQHYLSLYSEKDNSSIKLQSWTSWTWTGDTAVSVA